MVDIKALNADKGSMSSDYMRSCVMQAREKQEHRFRGTQLRFNSEISSREIRDFCPLGVRETAYMEKIFYGMNLSARSYHKILKVARTIADLGESDNIGMEHLAEAVCYQMREGGNIDAG